ncbi:MAG TPA: response regulator [Polyangiales bacterium]|nr:response regulator [Polyangiales bacterium]
MKTLQDVRVLMLSDAPRDSDQLSVWLPSEGASIDSRPWPEQALQLAGSPDVIVIDTHGNEARVDALLDQLKAASATAAIPLIGLSRRPITGSDAAAMTARFNKHLTQPFHPADLVGAIASLVKSMPVVPAAAPTHEESFRSLLETRIARKDLRGALALLNMSGPFRFTSVLRFEADERLTSLWTFDRENPDRDDFPVDAVTSSSYCVRVRDAQAPFQMPDSAADPSVANHPAKASVQSYCGVPLYREDGSFFGTLCQFDLVPRFFGDNTLTRLLGAAPVIQLHLDKLAG